MGFAGYQRTYVLICGVNNDGDMVILSTWGCVVFGGFFIWVSDNMGRFLKFVLGTYNSLY